MSISRTKEQRRKDRIRRKRSKRKKEVGKNIETGKAKIEILLIYNTTTITSSSTFLPSHFPYQSLQEITFPPFLSLDRLEYRRGNRTLFPSSSDRMKNGRRRKRAGSGIRALLIERSSDGARWNEWRSGRRMGVGRRGGSERLTVGMSRDGSMGG